MVAFIPSAISSGAYGEAVTGPEEVREFKANLQSRSKDEEKYQLCILKRDHLLQRQDRIEILFDAYDRVMSTECSQYQAKKARCQQPRASTTENDEIEQWNRFIGIAQSGSRQNLDCLKPLKNVSKCWGRDKIQHYEWQFRGLKYCKVLSAAANEVSDWDEAIIKLNALIVRRLQIPGRGGRKPKNSKNSIAQIDLENLKYWTNQGSYVKINDPEKLELLFRNPDKLPDDYGFDKFGLVVCREFATAPRHVANGCESSDRESILTIPENEPEGSSDHDIEPDAGRNNDQENDMRAVDTSIPSPETCQNSPPRRMALRPRDAQPKYATARPSGVTKISFGRPRCCGAVPIHVKKALDKLPAELAADDSIPKYLDALCPKHLRNFTRAIMTELRPQPQSTSDSSSSASSTRRRTTSDVSSHSDIPVDQYAKRQRQDIVAPSFPVQSAYNPGFMEDFRRQALEVSDERLSIQSQGSQGSHTHVGDRLVRSLLDKAELAREGEDVYFWPEDKVAAELESGNVPIPIVTQPRQTFQWNESKRPIEQLFEHMAGWQDNVSVNISGDEESRITNLIEVRQRFLANKIAADPWNIPSLLNPLPPGVLPAFLMGKNCRLLSRIHEILMCSSERVSTQWKEWKNMEEFAVLTEGGHNTTPSTHSHGCATWLTVQEGYVGFGWSNSSSNKPSNQRYVVLSPGQSIFFGSGAVYFTFRVQNYQTLMLGGHILQWTDIQRWVEVIMNSKPSASNLEYIEIVDNLLSNQFNAHNLDAKISFKKSRLREGSNKSPYVIVENLDDAENQLVYYHDIVLQPDTISQLESTHVDRYLDDKLILFYLWFLRDQLAYRQTHDCQVLDPTVMSVILTCGTASLEEGSPLDIFTPDFVIVPMHSDDEYEHWYLAIFCYLGSLVKQSNNYDDGRTVHQIPRLILLDSLFEDRVSGEGALKQLVVFEARRQDKDINISNLVVTSPAELQSIIPQQPSSNDYDCGLFCLIYSEMFLLDPPRFIQRYIVDKAPFDKSEWGNIQSNRIRQRYRILIERFAGSKRCNGVLVDGKGDRIIDGVLGLQGRGLMRAYQR